MDNKIAIKVILCEMIAKSEDINTQNEIEILTDNIAERIVKLFTIHNEPCPNCKETIEQCACMRNICTMCGKPVGNITFTICDECWNIKFPPNSYLELKE